MFEIVLTACLATGDVCATRLLPVGIVSRDDCTASAPDLAAAWASRFGNLTVQDVTCAPGDTLASSIEPLDVTEIAPGVFMHQGQHDVPSPRNRGDLANLGFIVGETGVAVIDAGTTRGVAERLYSAIREKTDLPIRWLLLTHMHPDHSLGASFYREAGARIVGHPNLISGLANRAESYQTALLRLLGAEAFLGTRLVGPDSAETPSEIDLGGRLLDLRTYPIAHTDNDMTVLDRQTGTLFAGDLVFAEHTPALDGSILGWQQVLADLTSLDVARVVPGHGPLLEDWPEDAQPIRGYLSALTEETRAAIDRGEPMSRAVDHLGESQRGDWELFDEFNKRNATAAFKELEWE